MTDRVPRRLAQGAFLAVAAAAAGLILGRAGLFHRPAGVMSPKRAAAARPLPPAIAQAVLERWSFPGVTVMSDEPTWRAMSVRGGQRRVWRFYAALAGIPRAGDGPLPELSGSWAVQGPAGAGHIDTDVSNRQRRSTFLRWTPGYAVRVRVNQPQTQPMSTIFVEVLP